MAKGPRKTPLHMDTQLQKIIDELIEMQKSMPSLTKRSIPEINIYYDLGKGLISLDRAMQTAKRIKA